MTPSTGTLNHPALGPVRYAMVEVSDNPDTQVAQVIGLMRGYAVEDSKSAEIQAVAHRVVQEGGGNPLPAIHRHVRALLGFVNDEHTAAPLQPSFDWPIVETLVRPRDILTSPAAIGDCDDYSMYGAALLLALNIPCSFVTVAADPGAPGIYSHVYLAAYPTYGPDAGQRIPLDCSHGPYAGWEVPNRFGKREEWPVREMSPALIAVIAAGVGLTLFNFVRARKGAHN